MKSHDHHSWEQKVPCSKSRNAQVYATSSGHGPPPAVHTHVRSTSGVTWPPGYISRASSTHSVCDPQLILTESDEWSLDSPKESGYYSEESSLGHSGEMPSSGSSSSSKHQGLRSCES